MRAAITGALVLGLSAQAVRAETAGKAPVAAAPTAKAECIKMPDAAQSPAGGGRLPGQAFPSEPLDEEEMGEALGPVAVLAAGIALMGGMVWLLFSGHVAYLASPDEPDTTYGLRPGH